MVPNTVTKVYFANNNLSDSDVSLLAKGLSLTKGLSTIAIVGNELGKEAYTTIAEVLIASKAFKSVKKFVLKNSKTCPYVNKVTLALMNQSVTLHRMKNIVLS